MKKSIDIISFLIGVSLPLAPHFSNNVFIILAIAFIVIIVRKRKIDLHSFKEFGLIAVFFLYAIISSFYFSGNNLESVISYNVYLVAWYIIGSNITLNFKNIFIGWGVSLSIVLVAYFSENYFGVSFAKDNYFFSIHKTYLSMQTVFWSVILFKNYKINTLFNVLFIVFILIIIFLLKSMIGVVLVGLVFTLWIVNQFKKPVLKKIIIISLAFFPYLFLAFLTTETANEAIVILDSDLSRVRNNKANFEAFKDEIFLGYGVGNEQKTIQSFRDKGSWEEINNYNAHNQYLEYLLGGGVVYLFLFSLIAFYSFSFAIKNNYNFIIFIILAMLYAMLSESIMLRQHGFYLFSMLIALQLTSKSEIFNFPNK